MERVLCEVSNTMEPPVTPPHGPSKPAPVAAPPDPLPPKYPSLKQLQHELAVQRAAFDEERARTAKEKEEILAEERRVVSEMEQERQCVARECEENSRRLAETFELLRQKGEDVAALRKKCADSEAEAEHWKEEMQRSWAEMTQLRMLLLLRCLSECPPCLFAERIARRITRSPNAALTEQRLSAAEKAVGEKDADLANLRSRLDSDEKQKAETEKETEDWRVKEAALAEAIDKQRQQSELLHEASEERIGTLGEHRSVRRSEH